MKNSKRGAKTVKASQGVCLLKCVLVLFGAVSTFVSLLDWPAKNTSVKDTRQDKRRYELQGERVKKEPTVRQLCNWITDQSAWSGSFYKRSLWWLWSWGGVQWWIVIGRREISESASSVPNNSVGPRLKPFLLQLPPNPLPASQETFYSQLREKMRQVIFCRG